MSVLPKPKHEALAQALFRGLAEGITQGEAYLAAGYGGERKDRDAARFHASRLLHNKHGAAIIARVKELQAEAARQKQATVESIVDELESARMVARENKQASAMVAASNAKAKILGLEVNRTEIGGPGDFSTANDTATLAEQLLKQAHPGLQITDQKRAMAIAELQRHVSALNAIAYDDAAVN
jgi:hypothetical protein